LEWNSCKNCKANLKLLENFRQKIVNAIASYRYWQDQFGRSDFTFGQFGENFTVEGLSDDAVRIGDRYRIGAGLFEVTQPRVTCCRSAFG